LSCARCTRCVINVPNAARILCIFSSLCLLHKIKTKNLKCKIFSRFCRKFRRSPNLANYKLLLDLLLTYYGESIQFISIINYYLVFMNISFNLASRYNQLLSFNGSSKMNIFLRIFLILYLHFSTSK